MRPINIQDLNPYQVQVLKISRQAEKKLLGQYEELLKKTSELSQQEITNLLPYSFQSIHNGPKPNLKIIFTVRAFQGIPKTPATQISTNSSSSTNSTGSIQSNSTTATNSTSATGTNSTIGSAVIPKVTYFYTTLAMVDMDDYVVQPGIFYEKIEVMANRTRCIAVHPNSQQLAILSQKHLQIHQIKWQQDSTYQLQLKHKLPMPAMTNNLKYTASGTHLIGLSKYNKQVKLVKFYINQSSLPATLEIKNSSLLNDKCVNSSQYSFLGRDQVVIDQNLPNQAAVCVKSNKVCIVDIGEDENNEELQVEVRELNLSNFIKKLDLEQINVKKDGVYSRLGVFNQMGFSSYVAYQSTTEIGVLFQTTKNSTDQVLSYSTRELLGYENNNAHCIQIPDIGSLGCYYQNKDNIQIVKIDRKDDLMYQMAFIKTYQQNQNWRIQSGFYYSKTSEYCTMVRQVLTCSQLSVSCTPLAHEKPLNQCNEYCKETNMFWNPNLLKCQNCINNCQCTNPKQSFNPFSKSCVLNCSKIPYASALSAYDFGKKCVCQRSFQWMDDIKTCRPICNNVNFSTGVNVHNNSQCACRTNFIFYPALQTFEGPGQCILACQNGEKPLDSHGQPYCKCSTFKYWSFQKNSCLFFTQAIYSFPAWAIVLICLGSILALALIVLGICKLRNHFKAKSEEEDKNKKEQLASPRITSRPISTNLESGSGSGSDIYTFNPPDLCAVCREQYLDDQEVDLKASCGHSFHEYCISKMLESNKSDCPECFIQIDKQSLQKIHRKSIG